ncbi:hypothetical protein Smp_072430 [Schistosoma mansoni]|uniref:hypothetical protein n=1 Tax=Schistosoma mansoni TaxID=6183 RepID=UPI00022DC743|nr:hypothetical protein Smp_072430 [Schistosoma mansoni]|eukprot:XP_018649139.1 hypothetical protein Smp_072430 [Schistosoma mansoni]
MAHPQLQSDHLSCTSCTSRTGFTDSSRSTCSTRRTTTSFSNTRLIRLPPPSQLDVRNHRGEKQEQPTHPDHHHVLVVLTLQHIQENTNVHHKMVENRCKF